MTKQLICILAGKCMQDEIKCHNEKCASIKYLCDESDDCGDGTDEEGCGKCVLLSETNCSLIAAKVRCKKFAYLLKFFTV